MTEEDISLHCETGELKIANQEESLQSPVRWFLPFGPVADLQGAEASTRTALVMEQLVEQSTIYQGLLQYTMQLNFSTAPPHLTKTDAQDSSPQPMEVQKELLASILEEKLTTAEMAKALRSGIMEETSKVSESVDELRSSYEQVTDSLKRDLFQVQSTSQDLSNRLNNLSDRVEDLKLLGEEEKPTTSSGGSRRGEFQRQLDKLVFSEVEKRVLSSVEEVLQRERQERTEGLNEKVTVFATNVINEIQRELEQNLGDMVKDETQTVATNEIQLSLESLRAEHQKERQLFEEAVVERVTKQVEAAVADTVEKKLSKQEEVQVGKSPVGKARKKSTSTAESSSSPGGNHNNNLSVSFPAEVNFKQLEEEDTRIRSEMAGLEKGLLETMGMLALDLEELQKEVATVGLMLSKTPEIGGGDTTFLVEDDLLQLQSMRDTSSLATALLDVLQVLSMTAASLATPSTTTAASPPKARNREVSSNSPPPPEDPLSWKQIRKTLTRPPRSILFPETIPVITRALETYSRFHVQQELGSIGVKLYEIIASYGDVAYSAAQSVLLDDIQRSTTEHENIGAEQGKATALIGEQLQITAVPPPKVADNGRSGGSSPLSDQGVEGLEGDEEPSLSLAEEEQRQLHNLQFHQADEQHHEGYHHDRGYQQQQPPLPPSISQISSIASTQSSPGKDRRHWAEDDNQKAGRELSASSSKLLDSAHPHRQDEISNYNNGARIPVARTSTPSLRLRTKSDVKPHRVPVAASSISKSSSVGNKRSHNKSPMTSRVLGSSRSISPPMRSSGGLIFYPPQPTPAFSSHQEEARPTIEAQKSPRSEEENGWSSPKTKVASPKVLEAVERRKAAREEAMQAELQHLRQLQSQPPGDGRSKSVQSKSSESSKTVKINNSSGREAPPPSKAGQVAPSTRKKWTSSSSSQIMKFNPSSGSW